MADIPQVIATYDALVGVALGAGLTYGLGALNRRHQEAREDATRWYEARREAYGALLIAASRVFRNIIDAPGKLERPFAELMDEIVAAVGAVRLVGSPEVIAAADSLVAAIVQDARDYGQKLMEIGPQWAEATGEDSAIIEKKLKDSSRAVRMALARKALRHEAW
jgi:hypothetical protein